MARQPRPNSVEYRMARALDELAEFEKFQEDLLPLLKKAINEGWDADKIYQNPKIQAMLAAKNVTIALTERDAGRAHAAVKDITDRTRGKPTEKREITHKAAQLTDQELDALLATKLADSAAPDDVH